MTVAEIFQERADAIAAADRRAAERLRAAPDAESPALPRVERDDLEMLLVDIRDGLRNIANGAPIENAREVATAMAQRIDAALEFTR